MTFVLDNINMATFRLLRDWTNFTLDGVSYRKIRKGYNPTYNLVNAIRLSDNEKVYIQPDTNVDSEDEVYKRWLRPMICETELDNLRD